MPCVDHDYPNCPAYAELGMGEKCPIEGCQRRKAPQGQSDALFNNNDDLEPLVIPGKSGGRQGTI